MPLRTAPPGPDRRAGVSLGVGPAPLKPSSLTQGLGLPSNSGRRPEDSEHPRPGNFWAPRLCLCCSGREPPPTATSPAREALAAHSASLLLLPFKNKFLFPLYWKSCPESPKHPSVCPPILGSPLEISTYQG